VHYSFQVKKLEATAASFEVSKLKKEQEQVFAPSDYRTPSGRPNHERIAAAIREALSAVESKITF
jgi:hypothetical protein